MCTGKHRQIISDILALGKIKYLSVKNTCDLNLNERWTRNSIHNPHKEENHLALQGSLNSWMTSSLHLLFHSGKQKGFYQNYFGMDVRFRVPVSREWAEGAEMKVLLRAKNLVDPERNEILDVVRQEYEKIIGKQSLDNSAVMVYNVPC